jgi:predicted O-methyltransferase YrrM
MGLATLLGPKPKGFFIPHRHADRVVPYGYPALEAQFAARTPAFLDLLVEIEGWVPDLLAMRGPPPAPRLDQDWFPRLDAAAAYAIVRRFRPRRIVEIGSGHSTRFLARAIADGRLACRLTCIDPVPRASLEGLDVEWLPVLVQDAPQNCFTRLQPGDVLFIDSSHILMPGTDVDRLLNHVLPLLAPRVMVHVHDIFLPDPYPETWAWRGYNEQAAIAVMLQGETYELEFASHYVVSRQAARLGRGAIAKLPHLDSGLESSLWLRKRDQPSRHRPKSSTP